MTLSNKDIALDYADVMWGQHDLELGLTYLARELAAPENLARFTELFEAFSDLRFEILEPGPIAEGRFFQEAM